MKRNLLQENMRRFATKNIAEQDATKSNMEDKIKKLIEEYRWKAEEFAELAFDYEYEDDSEVNRDKSEMYYKMVEDLKGLLNN